MMLDSKAVAGSRFPHAPLAWRAKWDELREVFNTKERPRPRHTTRSNIESPRHPKTRRIRGRQLSTLHKHLSCARRKCCRPACFNIPSSLACQHLVRQHASVPELPPHRPSQAYASQKRNNRWTSFIPLRAPFLLRPLRTTPRPEPVLAQPDRHSPPWTHRTTNSTQSPSSSTSSSTMT